MESYDLQNLDRMDSLAPNFGQQEGNLQPSNLLQFSGGTSSQAGSYGNSFGDLIEMDTIDIEANQFAQAVDEILGNFPIFEDSTITSESPDASDESLEFSDDNDPLIGNVSSLLAEVVWDTALSTVKEELETFTEDLAENIFDLTIANLGEQMGVLAPPEEPAAPESSDSLNEMALELGIFRVREQLENFANDEEFLDKMEQAFDDDFSSEEASNLIQDLASGEAIPEIEIVPASELNNANGAFGEGTIYLSEEFLSENVTNLEAVEDVLLEEIGHYIDEELGSDDSEGDEGDIFAQLVQDDETINDGELDDLQDEDDSADVDIDGEDINVELDVPPAAPPYPGYAFSYNGEVNVDYDENVELWQEQMEDLGYDLTVDGLYGPESESITIDFQEDQGLAVDGIVGPNTWEASFAAAPPYPGYLLEYDGSPSVPYDENVELWQEQMRHLGYDLTVDGLYGPESESIAREFQEDEGLTVDGIVGPNTWEASFDPTPPYPGDPFIYEEGKDVTYDENVETWQQQMKDVWDYDLAVDGLYGPESEGVTIDFQQDQGLAVDGIVGSNTWEASFAEPDQGYPSNPTSSNPLEGFFHPLNGQGTLTQATLVDGVEPHNDPGDRNYWAYDYGAPIGTPIYAMASGEVVAVEESFADLSPNESGTDESRANYVAIKLDDNDGVDDNYQALYIHVQQDSVVVDVGERVQTGELIARTGHNGYSTGPHLHVEVNRRPSSGSVYGETVPFVI